MTRNLYYPKAMAGVVQDPNKLKRRNLHSPKAMAGVVEDPYNIKSKECRNCLRRRGGVTDRL